MQQFCEVNAEAENGLTASSRRGDASRTQDLQMSSDRQLVGKRDLYISYEGRFNFDENGFFANT